MNQSPVVRFAPAPTGYLHVGSARAALFNWLFAERHGGRMVLRIEDTDRERNRPELIDTITDSLAWLGISWDGDPIHQSGRFEIYRSAVEKLLSDGRAYLVDGEDNRLDGSQLRDGAAVRVETPSEGATTFDDVIRGEVSFAHDTIEDFVIWRSNGTPTFLLANAVDDADLGITHVIRGEDLLSSTPKVLLLRDALGYGPWPVFAHLPLLVDEQRKKLSKRKHAVAVGDFRAQGYLPDAMANYLALLGWGPADDEEIMPMREIVAQFRLEDVSKSPAFFDLKKLDHINGAYIREMSAEAFIDATAPYMAEGPWPAERYDAETFGALAPLVQPRVAKLADAPGVVDFMFLAEPEIDQASWQKTMQKDPAVARAMLTAARDQFATVDWTAESLHAATLAAGEGLGLKLGKAQAPIRVAVTGRAVGPPLFEALALLGRDETLRRVESALTKV